MANTENTAEGYVELVAKAFDAEYGNGLREPWSDEPLTGRQLADIAVGALVDAGYLQRPATCLFTTTVGPTEYRCEKPWHHDGPHKRYVSGGATLTWSE